MDPTPVVPQPAATVVLLRPGPTGPEVLLTHRPSTMAFAADMHVFPGGRVDAADADAGLVARSVVTPEAAADGLGGDLDPLAAVAAYVAAIRESFEEAGILLADGPDDPAGPAAPIRPPTGAVLAAARARLLRDPGAFPAICADLDLRLRTDRLVPVSRWVTPPGLPRRFDARFFVAALPDGAEASLLGDEVQAQAWHTPRDALDAMASGQLGMWLPTSATLQQLEHARSMEDIRDRASSGRLGGIAVQDVAPDLVRVTMPAGGGVAGQPVHAYLAGRSEVVLVDPGDPTGPALDRAMAETRARGAAIVAVALTHVDPDHAAGAESIADQLGVPVFTGAGRTRDLPYAVTVLADDGLLPVGDVPMLAVRTPGPAADHVTFVVGDGPAARAVLSGDLDGVRGARAIPGPPDEAAWARSVARLRSVAPGAVWFGGHPALGR